MELQVLFAFCFRIDLQAAGVGGRRGRCSIISLGLLGVVTCVLRASGGTWGSAEQAFCPRLPRSSSLSLQVPREGVNQAKAVQHAGCSASSEHRLPVNPQHAQPGPGPGHVVLYTLKEALSWGEGSRDTKFCTSVILLPFHEVRRETVHRTQHHLLGGLPHGTV